MLGKLLRERMGAYRWVIAAMLAFHAVQTACTLVLPTLSARLIDNGLAGRGPTPGCTNRNWLRLSLKWSER